MRILPQPNPATLNFLQCYSDRGGPGLPIGQSIRLASSEETCKMFPTGLHTPSLVIAGSGPPSSLRGYPGGLPYETHAFA